MRPETVSSLFITFPASIVSIAIASCTRSARFIKKWESLRDSSPPVAASANTYESWTGLSAVAWRKSQRR